MTDRPILFSAPMIRAILAGQKTQTRRVVKWRGLTPGLNLGFSGLSVERSGSNFVLTSPTRTSHEYVSVPQPSPYGTPGDRLWVREAWNKFDGWAMYSYRADDNSFGIGDSDDPDYVPEHALKWKPSIHMPRAASRITLNVTGVRVERLQAISEADALAEGIVPQHGGGFGLPAGEHYHALDPRISYWSLWGAINGAGSVEANPWVWVIEFERTAALMDHIESAERRGAIRLVAADPATHDDSDDIAAEKAARGYP